jgi:hypothetical protein
MHTKSRTRPLTCRPMIAAAFRRPEAPISVPSTVTSSQTLKTTQTHDRARENIVHPDPPPQQVVHETGASNEPRHAMGDPRNPAEPRPAARLRPTTDGSCDMPISIQRWRRVRVAAGFYTPVTTREVSTVSEDFSPLPSGPSLIVVAAVGNVRRVESFRRNSRRPLAGTQPVRGGGCLPICGAGLGGGGAPETAEQKLCGRASVGPRSHSFRERAGRVALGHD